MAFITNNSTVISFAEYQDVLDADQRLFEANEGLTDDVIETVLIRSTERILSLIKHSDWWRDLYVRTVANPVLRNKSDVPDVTAAKIISRQHDFTDLCVFYAMYFYILPKIADFSSEDNAERAKIGFYQGKFQLLFDELINAGDWYDVSGDGTITGEEKYPGNYMLKRVR
jgi:hypothetical protein